MPELPEWWSANPKGITGFSYCLVNVTSPQNFFTLDSHITPWMKHQYEILCFTDDKSMRDLLAFCKFDWVMRVDVTPYKTDPSYDPRVSIILPTYKRQHTLPRTLASILGQSHQNWELIIVNNEVGGAVEVPADPRITVYEHAEEANACYARNSGVQHATGDLVCFFDDDDVMLPDYLAKMSAPFCDPEVRIVKCGMALDGFVDFSFSTQEAWLRREHATATWMKGDPCHDQIYYHSIIAREGWTRSNIIQTGEVLVKAGADPQGGLRASGGF